MTAETCTTCGLPSELCVCDDVEKSDLTLTVDVEERKYNDVTLVTGLDDYDEIDDLESELKQALACGGTSTNDTIELQGDHRGRVEDELRERGFEVNE